MDDLKRDIFRDQVKGYWRRESDLDAVAFFQQLAGFSWLDAIDQHMAFIDQSSNLAAGNIRKLGREVLVDPLFREIIKYQGMEIVIQKFLIAMRLYPALSFGLSAYAPQPIIR